MSANDVFADVADREADLALLENLRWGRREFLNRICEASESRDADVLATLRLESTYQVAEFFYLLRAHRVDSREQIQMLAEMHNQYIIDLTKDAAKTARLGLSHDRLLDAIFTADTMPRLIQHWAERPGTFDQSNLARFLAALMSSETCRKVIVACAKAGFVVRDRSPYGSVLVRSAGTLERLFGENLRDLRRRIEQAG